MPVSGQAMWRMAWWEKDQQGRIINHGTSGWLTEKEAKKAKQVMRGRSGRTHAIIRAYEH